jgi:hypothetical protein
MKRVLSVGIVCILMLALDIAIVAQEKNLRAIKQLEASLQGSNKDSLTYWFENIYREDYLFRITKAHPRNLYNILTYTLSDSYFDEVTEAHFDDLLLHNTIVMEVDKSKQLFDLAKLQYYDLILERYRDDLGKILFDYPADITSWLPFSIQYSGEFALLFHHIARQVVANESNYKNGLSDDICGFLEYNYNSSSCKLFKKAENNMKVVLRNEKYITAPYIKVKSSEVLSEKYTVNNLLDSNLDICWAVGENGLGHWFELSLEEKTDIFEIVMFNGYAKSEKLFKANARIKSAQLIIDDSIHIELEFKDQFYPTVVEVDKLMTKVRFVINEVYPGSKYKDLCVSEIAFIRRD